MSYPLRIRKEFGTAVEGHEIWPLHVVQRLLPRDEVTRVEFCNPMLGSLNEDTGVPDNVLTRYEAHLQVSYFVIKQNVRYRAPVYTREIHERALPSPKMKRKCGVRWEHSRMWVSFLVISAKMLQLMMRVAKLPTAVAST